MLTGAPVLCIWGVILDLIARARLPIDTRRETREFRSLVRGGLALGGVNDTEPTQRVGLFTEGRSRKRAGADFSVLIIIHTKHPE